MCIILDHLKLEQERGNMASSVTCYMKEHGVQENEAIEQLRKMLDEDWKQINKEYCLDSTYVPVRLLGLPVNLRRIPELFFMFGDGYTHSDHLKEVIASLLVNPVPT